MAVSKTDNGLQDQINNLNSKFNGVNKLVQATLKWNSTNNNFPIGDNPEPLNSVQHTVVARNVNNGGIYVLWYGSGNRAFNIGYTISGSNPGSNNEVSVQYFA